MAGRAYQNQLATALLEFMRCTTVTATPRQCPDRRNTSTDQVRGALKTRNQLCLLCLDEILTPQLTFYATSLLSCCASPSPPTCLME